MITAKVKCQSKDEIGEGDNRQTNITFVADYADGRNKEWAMYTPALSLSMQLKGKVGDLFEKDKTYTLQFVENDD